MWKWFKTESDKKIEASHDVKWLQSMQKLDVKDGDTVVVTFPRALSIDTGKNVMAAIKNVIKDSLGITVNIMILEEGMQIGLLRKEN